jgi:transposase
MLGIDVSKDTLTATLIDPTTRQVQWELEVPHTDAGVARLLARSPITAPWVLEPTGRWSLQVARQATAAQRSVLLAQPRKAKAFLSSLSSRAKTDRIDSRGLAVYGCSASLAPYPLKSDAVDQLDQLLTARKGIADAVMRLRQQQTELPYAAVALEPAISGLAAQLKDLDRQVATQSKALSGDDDFPLAVALDEIPGVGPITAAALTSRLLSKSFVTPDAFVAYIGLDVRVRDSGRHRGQRKLTKQGDAQLRRLLYLSAQASLRHKDPTFRAQYEGERGKGLGTTGALCAVARKMAKVAWSMARHRTRYDPQRVRQQS